MSLSLWKAMAQPSNRGLALGPWLRLAKGSGVPLKGEKIRLSP